MDNARYLIDNNFINEPKKYGNLYIIQVGRRFFGENRLMGEHFHGDYFELTVVNKGNATIWGNDTFTKVKEGEIFLSFPNEMHQMVAEDSGFEYDFFSFKTIDTELEKQLKKIMQENPSANQRVFTDENIKTLIISLIGEFVNKNPMLKEKIISGLAEQISYYVIRDFSKDKGKKFNKDVNNHDIFCYHVMKYIDQNLLSIKNLSVLEQVFSYNYSYVSDLFSKTTGITVVEYYGNKRMEKAKELIKEGKLSINQIANILNYSSVYSFSKSFKQKYGFSPTKLN